MDQERMRGLSEDRTAIRAQTLAEIAEAWHAWSTAEGRRRKAAGEPVEEGELKGVGYTTSRLVLWYLRQPEEVRGRIQREGDAELMRLRRLPRDDYRLVLEQRGAKSSPPDNPAAGKGVVHPRPIGAHGSGSVGDGGVDHGDQGNPGDREPARHHKARGPKH